LLDLTHVVSRKATSSPKSPNSLMTCHHHWSARMSLSRVQCLQPPWCSSNWSVSRVERTPNCEGTKKNCHAPTHKFKKKNKKPNPPYEFIKSSLQQINFCWKNKELLKHDGEFQCPWNAQQRHCDDTPSPYYSSSRPWTSTIFLTLGHYGASTELHVNRSSEGKLNELSCRKTQRRIGLDLSREKTGSEKKEK
jgi:hypothetical protein